MNKFYLRTIFIKFLFAFMCVTLLAELGVKQFITAPSNHVFDAEIGFRYRPHSELFLATEGFSRNMVNALGLNDDEYKPEKRLKKAIVLGDSYTEARQVDRKANFTSLAENNLIDWDIINAGRDGLHIINTFEIAKRLAGTIKPNLIVLIMNNGDYRDDLTDPNIQLTLQENQLIDISLKIETKEELKNYFVWIIQHSALAMQLVKQFKPIIIDIHTKFLSIFNKSDAQISPSINVNNNNRQQEQSEILLILLEKLKKIAPVAILYINQVEIAKLDDVYAAKIPLNSANKIQEIAKKHNIIFINTANYLVNEYHKHLIPPFGFNNHKITNGHLNEHGHNAVALALTDLIHKFEKGEIR